MANKQDKLQELYDYFLRRGDNQSVDAIAKGLCITKKTLFNRYGNREGILDAAQNFWRQQFLDSYSGKVTFCSNPVEKLLILISEVRRFQRLTPFYLNREIKIFTKVGCGGRNFFFKLMQDVLGEGISRYCFRSNLNCNYYILYFFHNLFHFFLADGDVEVLYLLFSPLLTESGEVLLQDIDIQAFMESA